MADTVEDAATNTQPEAPPAEQAPAADKVEDAATNTQPEAQAQSESVPTTETHRTERPTPDVIPSATYAPPPPPESEYMQNTERPPSPPPEQRGEEQRDDESQEQPEELDHGKRKRRRYMKSKTWRTGIRNPGASHVALIIVMHMNCINVLLKCTCRLIIRACNMCLDNNTDALE